MKKITFTIVVLMVYLFAFNCSYSQKQSFSVKDAYKFAVEKSKEMVSDSFKLSYIKIDSIDHVKNGLGTDWQYYFCYNDSCKKFIINKYSDTFRMSGIFHSDIYGHDLLPLDSNFIDSDSLYPILERCLSDVDGLLKWKPKVEYRLNRTDHQSIYEFEWLVQFKDTMGGMDDILVYINAITSQCYVVVYNINEIISSQVKEVKIIPNPSINSISIDFSNLNSSQNISLHITNILGTTCLVNNFQPKEGKHSINIDISSLLPGLYFCTIKSGNYFEVKKLIVVK